MKLLKTIFILAFSIFIVNGTMAQNYKPYILAATSNAALSDATNDVKSQLSGAGFDLLGEYSPANDPNRVVLIISSGELRDAIETIGGLTGFASALRVGITLEDGVVNISYTNPIYLGNAYFRSEYNKVESNFTALSEKLVSAIANVGETMNTPFGSEKGVPIRSLRKYRYMVGMQRFDDVTILNEFDSFEDAVIVIDKKLALSNNLVYSVEYPEKKLKLYGIAIDGKKGEEHFLPIIDISKPQHTAFLPYELLVMENKAVMLHGRYRIALSFPDLTMMTFSKIMSTPGDIKNTLKKYTE